MRLIRSNEWSDRANAVIPLGTQTFSKSTQQFVQGVTPIFVDRALGSRFWDVDGNEFLDYPMALGPVILGYCEPSVNEAVRRQLDRGMTFSLCHPLEVEVAERIVEFCPGVEAVRFGKSGSDAVSAAIRAARSITEREHVLCLGYHGWHDWYIGTTTRAAGIPQSTRELSTAIPFGDIDALTDAFELCEDVAAVVLEPSGASVPDPGYLEMVIQVAHREGALVIFDEVITGFRLGRGGARERYSVEPDFSCYGKALGNGMPISVVGGRWEIMSVFEQIFYSGTHGGETLSLAAAQAVLTSLADGEVHRWIRSLGLNLQAGIDKLVSRYGLTERVSVTGEPERSVVNFHGEFPLIDKSFVQQTLAQHRILFNGSMFICGRHSCEEIEETLSAFEVAFEIMSEQADMTGRLKGPPVQPVFRKP